MARRRQLGLLAALFTAALFTPSRADACSCVGGRPLCDTFWRMSSVFAGEVIDIVEFEEPTTPGVQGRHLRRRVKLRVDRAFRGDSGAQIEVFTGVGGGDCGYPFQRGEKYLVFASSWEGRLSVSACGPTRRLADATEELAYVSQSFLPAVGGRVFGQAQLGSGQSRSPAANYTIQLRGGGRQWTATTNAGGAFEFMNIPAGKYSLDATVPDTLFVSAPSEIELTDPRGCSRADLSIEPNGRITVPVILATGAPPQQIDMELIPVESLKESYQPTYEPFEYDARSGHVEWSQLPPGRYVIGINITRAPGKENPIAPVFHPGVKEPKDATVVLLGPGERVSVAPFQLPTHGALLAVRGTVVRPDSSAVAKVNVRLESAEPFSEGQLIDSTETDSQGRFALQGITGARVRVVVYVNYLLPSEPFELTPETAPILMVLRPPKKERP